MAEEHLELLPKPFIDHIEENEWLSLSNKWITSGYAKVELVHFMPSGVCKLEIWGFWEGSHILAMSAGGRSERPSIWKFESGWMSVESIKSFFSSQDQDQIDNKAALWQELQEQRSEGLISYSEQKTQAAVVIIPSSDDPEGVLIEFQPICSWSNETEPRAKWMATSIGLAPEGLQVKGGAQAAPAKGRGLLANPEELAKEKAPAQKSSEPAQTQSTESTQRSQRIASRRGRKAPRVGNARKTVGAPEQSESEIPGA